MPSTPAAHQLARIFIASYVFESVFVVGPWNRGRRATILMHLRKGLKRQGVVARGANMVNPGGLSARLLWQRFAQPLMRQEWAVSSECWFAFWHWVISYFCQEALMKCLPGVCQETAEGRSQTCGSLLEFGVIAEDGPSNRRAQLKIKSSCCVAKDA